MLNARLPVRSPARQEGASLPWVGRPKYALALAIGLLVAVGIGMSLGGPSEPETRVLSGPYPVEALDGPFPVASAVSLEDAQKAVSFGVLLSTSKFADKDSLGQVWVTPSSDEETESKIALVYSTGGGTLTIIEQVKQFGSVDKAFGDVLAQGSAEASVVADGRAPMLVIQPNSDDFESNPAYVEVVIDGVDINIFSDELSAADHVGVAKTLA
jgi:hypothetical protein